MLLSSGVSFYEIQKQKVMLLTSHWTREKTGGRWELIPFCAVSALEEGLAAPSVHVCILLK